MASHEASELASRYPSRTGGELAPAGAATEAAAEQGAPVMPAPWNRRPSVAAARSTSPIFA